MVHALQMELEGTGVRASIVRPGPTWSEMGTDWDDAAAADVLNAWVRFGLARHPHFLKPEAIAHAVATWSPHRAAPTSTWSRSTPRRPEDR